VLLDELVFYAQHLSEERMTVNVVSLRGPVVSYYVEMWMCPLGGREGGMKKAAKIQPKKLY
jgi:hypothetical protein